MRKSRREPKFWKICPTCFQMVYSSGMGTGNHICPETLKAKREAELDMVIDSELSTWNRDVKEFWASSDVKFWEYLLEQEKKKNG